MDAEEEKADEDRIKARANLTDHRGMTELFAIA